MTISDRVETGVVRRIKDHLGGRIAAPFNVRMPNGNIHNFGEGEPSFTVVIKNLQALSAVMLFDEVRFAEAYISGSVDIEGDMWGVMSYRKVLLNDLHPLHHGWQRALSRLAGQTRSNRRAIGEHYERESEFYLKFMDPTRCYSQAVFESDNEPLETAQRRKLEFAVTSCGLKPGNRVLDVGGGWGSFVEYAGKQGIHVTALTIARKSEEFINNLINRLKLPCKVIYGDFYEYASPEPYDAIAILGVMEHLPDYPAVVRQFQRLLKPGGKVYLDASAFREKYSKSTFMARYVFPENHRYFCLHDFLAQIAKTDFEVDSVHNDRHSYYLTAREWARNLDAQREEFVRRWGEKSYRIFRLYLWGASHAFYSRGMEAFRVVLERPGEGG